MTTKKNPTPELVEGLSELKSREEKKFSSVLQAGETIRKLISRLHDLEQLQAKVLSQLDEATAAHCRVANFNNGILVLSTDSPVWHHKVRFRTPEILSHLRQSPHWAGIKGIEVRIDYLAPDISEIQEIPHKRDLTDYARDLLNSLASNVSNTKLSKSLQRLAKHKKNV